MTRKHSLDLTLHVFLSTHPRCYLNAVLFKRHLRDLLDLKQVICEEVQGTPRASLEKVQNVLRASASECACSRTLTIKVTNCPEKIVKTSNVIVKVINTMYSKNILEVVLLHLGYVIKFNTSSVLCSKIQIRCQFKKRDFLPVTLCILYNLITLFV